MAHPRSLFVLAAALVAGCGASGSPAADPPEQVAEPVAESPTPAAPAPDRTPAPPAAAADGHCAEGEASWFECTTAAGRLSVCGPEGGAAATTWLQLRHGPPGEVDARLPEAATSLKDIRWERSEDTSSVLRAVHFGEGAAVFTVRPTPGRGDPSAGALLAGLDPVGCRWSSVVDALPELATRLAAPDQPLAAYGTLGPLQPGDTACYVFLGSNAGARTYYAEFEVCTSAAELVGRDVVLDFTADRVIAPSCQGDPECADHIDVQLVTGVRPQG